MTRIRQRAVADAGFTLTELLVSMVIFGIVSAMVTTASITGLHRQTEVANRDDALAQLRTVLQRIDRDIRSADPLLSVSSTQLIVKETQSTYTHVVTYSVAGSTLVQDQTSTSPAGVTTAARQRTLLSNLVLTDPLFTVSPRTGYAAPAGSSVNTSTCVLSGAIDVGCVGSITVKVSVRLAHLPNPLTMTDSGVELRNVS